uniref:Uncharacterized protein n=1 Tax=Cacopsylla melanoneura TaxID=428564 RepID=A0A8D8XDA9_9HEMI
MCTSQVQPATTKTICRLLTFKLKFMSDPLQRETKSPPMIKSVCATQVQPLPDLVRTNNPITPDPIRTKPRTIPTIPDIPRTTIVIPNIHERTLQIFLPSTEPRPIIHEVRRVAIIYEVLRRRITPVRRISHESPRCRAPNFYEVRSAAPKTRLPVASK